MNNISAHGGNLRLASRQYGKNEADWLDFSANINPLGIPQVLLECVENAFSSGALLHYPDPDSTELRILFAEKHNLSPEEVLVTNGASEALQLALAALPKGDVALPVPCFGEYGFVAALAGNAVCPLPMSADRFDLPHPRRRYVGVILGNPNNPTSRLPGRDCLLAWLDACDWAIVDEAFVELTVAGEANSVVPLMERYPNLIVVRALTKVLAIPGLRLGYVLAKPDQVELMKKWQAAWSVNALAQAVVASLPLLGGYLLQTKQWIETEPCRLHAHLEDIPGLASWPPDTNFILCRSNSPTAHVVDSMAHKGILLRDASNFQGLDGNFFRLAVRLHAENERLLAAFREALSCD